METNVGVIPTSNPYVLGIDLGTTNSCASIVVNDQTVVLNMERAGQETIPSVVRFEDRNVNEARVGSAAKKYKLIKPNEVFSSVKSLMQDEKWQQDKNLLDKYTFGDCVLSPKDIAQKILEEVLHLAQQNEGYGDKGSFDKVVICVPANSTPQYKQYIKDIAKEVGFGLRNEDGSYKLQKNGDIEGIYLLSEPSAAAIAYAKEKGILENCVKDKTQTLLVYDFGGGTFDVTILSVVIAADSNPVFEILGTYGVPELGGDDIDKALMQLVAQQFYDETGIDLMDPTKDNKGNSPKTIYQAQAWLKEEAERAKIEFSNGVSEYNFENPGMIDDNDANKTCNLECLITKEQFENAIAALINQTIECVDGALQASNITIDSIDRFILVGGSCKGPWIRQAIKNKYEREPYCADNLDTIVSRGAAIYGGEVLILDPPQPEEPERPELPPREGGITIIEKTAQHIGVELRNGYFSPLVEKGSELTAEKPCTGSGLYTNSDENNSISIGIWGTGRNLDVTNTSTGSKIVYEPVHGKDDDGKCLYDFYGNVSIDVPKAPAGEITIELQLTVYHDNSLKISAIVNGGEPQEYKITKK